MTSRASEAQARADEAARRCWDRPRLRAVSAWAYRMPSLPGVRADGAPDCTRSTRLHSHHPPPSRLSTRWLFLKVCCEVPIRSLLTVIAVDATAYRIDQLADRRACLAPSERGCGSRRAVRSRRGLRVWLNASDYPMWTIMVGNRGPVAGDTLKVAGLAGLAKLIRPWSGVTRR